MTQPKDAKRLTSGQVGPKCRVWGGSPTSIFPALRGRKKASVNTLALLAVSAHTEMMRLF